MPSIFSRLIERLPFFPRGRPGFTPELRAALPALKHSWEMLLSANTRLWSQISSARQSSDDDVFVSMVHVRTRSTAMCVDVFAMLRYLKDMSGRDPVELEHPFQSLQAAINREIAGVAEPSGVPLIMPLGEIDAAMSQVVGTKMAHLGEIRKTFPDFRIPEGFVATSAAYHLFMNCNGLRDEINRRLQTVEVRDLVDMFRVSSELQLLIINSPLPDELQEALRLAYRDLEAKAGRRGVRVAVRSSAVGEDTVETSFAGQYRTELNVGEDLLFMAYKEVLASKYALTAMNYRLSLGLKDEDLPMCVGCMIMEDSSAGGVMYTQDPTSPDTGTLFVNAVHGLGKAISDGYVNPDHWEVSKQPELRIQKQVIRNKRQKIASFLSEEGVTLIPTPPSQSALPSLTEGQVLALSRIGVALENHFQYALDIEWSVSKGGEPSLLQARPLKRVSTGPPKPGNAPPAAEILARGGQTASPGTASGTVFVVRNNTDLLQFPEGAVLVTTMPHPRWSALLPRAAAVVTEQGGGIFGHLANIAREFGIPALFDVQDATTILRTGMRVTVHASRLVVSAEDPSLPEQAPRRRRKTPVDSPVFKTLFAVMSKVDPLTSLNPLAPRLSPDKIKTLRDIAHACNLLACRQVLALAGVPGLTHALDVKHSADWRVLDLDDPGLGNARLPGHSPQPVPLSRHPLLKAVWSGLSRHPEHHLKPTSVSGARLGFLHRLFPVARPVPAPHPRIFVVSGNICHLYLSVDQASFFIQAQTGETMEENSASLLWQWQGPRRPSSVWLDGLVPALEQRGFEVDRKEDGCLLRSSGRTSMDIAGRACFLGFLIGHVLQWRENPTLPQEMGLPTSKEG